MTYFFVLILFLTPEWSIGHIIDMGQFSPPKDLAWLFFDLNSYFASVEQQDQSALRGRPVAVVPSDTDATSAIAASYEAKAYGIKTGTKIYEAKRLCPDLVCVLARHHIYVDYHQAIMAEVEKHIPVTKICSIDEAACKLMKNEREEVKAVALAHRIKDGLRRNVGKHIKCSIGLAPNAFLAKVATDMQKPDGLVILRPDEYAERLFELNLRDLCGIGANIERRLYRGGIPSVKALYNAAPKQIRKIWGGVEGEKFWYRLHGYDVPDIETKKSVIGHSRVLDPSFRSCDKALSMVLQLTTKACARLRRHNLYAGRFSLSVRGVNGMYWGKEQRIIHTQDSFVFTKTVQELWHEMMYVTRWSHLKKVSINLYDLREAQNVTLDLFDQSREKTGTVINNLALSQAIDGLNQKFGSSTVNLGMCPKTSSGYVGTKIAFSRVPTADEFRE